MANIYPLGDRLKVLPLKPPASVKSGDVEIHIPSTSEARERPKEGLVLAVGRGVTLETGALVPLESEVGDVVQFGKYAGIVVFDEEVGHDVLLLRESEALGRKKRAELPAEVPGDPRSEAVREAEAKEHLELLRRELIDHSA